VSRNTIVGGETHAILVTDTAFTIDKLRIGANTVTGCAGSYVAVNGTTFDAISITGNTCRSGTAAGKAISVALPGGREITTLEIGGNIIDARMVGGDYTHGIYVSCTITTPSKACIHNNQVDIYGETSGIGIYVAPGCFVGIDISNNMIWGGSGSCISTGGSQTGGSIYPTLRIAGNSLMSSVGAAVGSINVTTGDNISISANVIYECYGVGVPLPSTWRCRPVATMYVSPTMS